MRNLTGFVKSLVGSKPANPKEPQGDLYSEKTVSATNIVKDSVVVKDSAAVK
jgi:hypothetical protein